jgi:predicted AAA+ superfamily ATPase
VARDDPRRRGRFLDSYVQNLIDRDVRQLAEIERAPQLVALVRLLAARSGQLLGTGSLESELQLSRPTGARYVRLLEEVFLIKRIPGWSRNLATRATGMAKLAFVDSGIAARLLAMDGHGLRRPAAPFGPLLEGFVLAELRIFGACACSRIGSATTSSSGSCCTRDRRRCRSDPRCGRYR